MYTKFKNIKSEIEFCGSGSASESAKQIKYFKKKASYVINICCLIQIRFFIIHNYSKYCIFELNFKISNLFF